MNNFSGLKTHLALPLLYSSQDPKTFPNMSRPGPNNPYTHPRDLIGYGRNPPNPRWPNNAKLAVQFVINYEEGGENCILDGDT